MTLDARPSDAVALALRAGVPLYAAEAVEREHAVEGDGLALPRFSPKVTPEAPGA